MQDEDEALRRQRWHLDWAGREGRRPAIGPQGGKGRFRVGLDAGKVAVHVDVGDTFAAQRRRMLEGRSAAEVIENRPSVGTHAVEKAPHVAWPNQHVGIDALAPWSRGGYPESLGLDGRALDVEDVRADLVGDGLDDGVCKEDGRPQRERELVHGHRISTGGDVTR